MVDFVERHAEKIAGVLACLDRVVITGILPDIGHAQAATSYLFNHKIRIFDHTKFDAFRWVLLRYFAGSALAEAADILGISSRSAGGHWAFARAWLHLEMESGP